MCCSFCAGIVTYNPDLNTLKKNIDAIYNQVKKLIVVDNGSKNINDIVFFISEYKAEIIVIKNCQNMGIAYALNQICKYAIDYGFEWCITLDQDSVCSETFVNEMKKIVSKKVAVAGPDICYVNNSVFFKKKTGIENVEWVISSASVVNLNIWKELEGFDESLFIDGVDKDYCIRANKLGYLVVKNNDVLLEHELGNLNCRTLFGKSVFVTFHSPLRKRYMVRNSIYLRRKLKYGNPIIYISCLLLKTIFYESHKFLNIKSIVLGINDGLRFRMGALQ